MHQAVDPLLQLQEYPEIGDVAHLAGDPGPHRELEIDGVPGVRLQLPEAQGDLLLVLVYLQDHRVHLLADGDHLGGVLHLLGPGHLRDVNQALHPALQLDEGPVVHDGDDPAADLGPDRVLGLDVLPGVRLQLLEAQGDTGFDPVVLQDLHLEQLADLDHLRGMVDSAPGHVGDVQQAVQPAQVHEHPEVGDVLDDALAQLALVDLGQDGGAHLVALGVQHRPAGDDDVPLLLVDLDDLERHRLPDEAVHRLQRPEADLGAGQEGVHAHQVDDQAALDALDHLALHLGLAVHRGFDLVPDPDEIGLRLGEDHLPVLVLHLLQQQVQDVADLDLVQAGELRGRHHPLRLETDVHYHRVEGDAGHRPPDDLALLELAVLVGLVQQGPELLGLLGLLLLALGGELLLDVLGDRFLLFCHWLGHAPLLRMGRPMPAL